MVPKFERRVRAFAADVSGVTIALLIAMYGIPNFDGSIFVKIAIVLFAYLLIVILPIFSESKSTFGQRLQKIRVVNFNDSEPSRIKLILRELTKYALSFITFGLYLIIAFFALTEKYSSRTIHDYIFKTKMIDIDPLNQDRDYKDPVQTRTMKDTRLWG